MKLLVKVLIYSVCAFFIVGPIMTGMADECSPATGDPIRLGAIFPQEALFISRNSDYYNGIEVMRRAVNACGGVHGRPVEWLYEPANNRSDAAAAARKLIEEDQVPLIVGSGLLAVSEGARTMAEERGVVYWEVTESIESEGEWSFSIRADNRQIGTATGQFVSEALSVTLKQDMLRVALIYENRPRGQSIAAGVIDALPYTPFLSYHYTDRLADSRRLGVQLRENRIDVVILAAFENDGDNLWYAARESNANVGAWLHVGGEGYGHGMCDRVGNANGLISVEAAGPVSSRYREAKLGELYRQYRRAFLAEHSRAPNPMADLAASGVYMLLRYVLPNTDSGYSADGIRSAIHALDDRQPLGLMGEGISFVQGNGRNMAARVLFQQAQNGAFCTIWPDDVATCQSGLQPFPTWRERALIEERETCDPQT